MMRTVTNRPTDSTPRKGQSQGATKKAVWWDRAHYWLQQAPISNSGFVLKAWPPPE
jgi:hypothetical protein